MKLFYIPTTKAIIAKYNNKFVSLPLLTEIDKPVELIPCISFLKEKQTSKWFNIISRNPDIDGFHIHLDKYHLLGQPNRCPSKIKIHKIELDVATKENSFQLSGNLPEYVLNGICNLLIKEYYD